MHTYTLTNSMFDGPITNLLSILCILIEILSKVHAWGKKSLNGLRFGIFIGRFPSEGAASMVVKGLKGGGGKNIVMRTSTIARNFFLLFFDFPISFSFIYSKSSPNALARGIKNKRRSSCLSS